MARQKTLLPAELALAKIDEMDPVRQELDEVITRQAIAHIEAVKKHVEDNEFDAFREEDVKEMMSNQAIAEGMEPHIAGYQDREAEAKVGKMKAKIHLGAGGSASGSGSKQLSPRDIEAALTSAGWGMTTPSTNAGHNVASRRLSVNDYISRLTQFTGLGYAASYKDYVSRRFEDAMTTTKPTSEEKKSKQQQREANY